MRTSRTMASCRPMFPTVTPPEKNMQGSQERMYRKSGDVYLQGERKPDGRADPCGSPAVGYTGPVDWNRHGLVTPERDILVPAWLLFTPVVPNLFGTRDRFHGKQFFTNQGVGGQEAEFRQ